MSSCARRIPPSIPCACAPPDAADGGVDLAALVVVRAPEARAAAQSAAELLRSGAFGLAVVDLVSYSAASIPLPSQTLLSGLAQKHDAVVVFLTEKACDSPSIGSLVSLRARARRRPVARGPGRLRTGRPRARAPLPLALCLGAVDPAEPEGRGVPLDDRRRFHALRHVRGGEVGGREPCLQDEGRGRGRRRAR